AAAPGGSEDTNSDVTRASAPLERHAPLLLHRRAGAAEGAVRREGGLERHSSVVVAVTVPRDAGVAVLRCPDQRGVVGGGGYSEGLARARAAAVEDARRIARDRAAIAAVDHHLHRIAVGERRGRHAWRQRRAR